MSRYSEECPRHGYRKSIGKHIFYVFKGSKAQRYKYGINHSVKHVVEIRITPGTSFKEKQLGSLLNHSYHQESKNYVVVWVIAAQSGIKHSAAEAF